MSNPCRDGNLEATACVAGGNVPWDVTGPDACKSQPSPKRRPLAAAATVRGAQVLPPASATPSPKAGQQYTGAVSEDGSLLGWSPERLRRMADYRTRIWAAMVNSSDLIIALLPAARPQIRRDAVQGNLTS